MHHFYAPELPEPGALAMLDREEESHLFRTLRAAPGLRVGLLDGHGAVAEGVVEPGRSVRVVSRQVASEPSPRLVLACAAPRRQKLDLLLKQAVELGAAEIWLLNCERSVAQPENCARMSKLLLEACKQSGNPYLPVLREGVSLSAALEQLQAADYAVFFGSVAPVANRQRPAPRLAWLVGPEGGFTADEERLLCDRGALPLQLGPYTLRLETAAVAGLALLRALTAPAEPGR